MANPLERLVEVFNALRASHKELSILTSAIDEPHGPSPRLLRLTAEVITIARKLDFAFLDERTSAETRWYRTWPGEHYRLLAALTRVLSPHLVVEFGTATGMSALTIAEHLPPKAHLHTFDVVPWTELPNTWLRSEDFAGGRITQHVEDLSRPEIFARHAALLADADLLFIDGPKDRTTETALLGHLAGLRFTRRPIVLFDDIRLLAMLELWRELARPKLDVTSFGHWSGSGLVDWAG